MQECQVPTANMLQNPVRIKVQAASCDFECVKEKAISKASEHDNAPVLLSWFDRKRMIYSPNDECCVEGEPNWLAYAQAKKADLIVDVNDEEYVFMFKRSHGLP